MIYDFRPKEKVFSLNKAAIIPDRDNLPQLWEDFFCLMVLAGFFVEGNHWYFEDKRRRRSSSTSPVIAYENEMLDENFHLPPGEFHPIIGKKISSALHLRAAILYEHRNSNEGERALLKQISGAFSQDRRSIKDLSAKRIFGIALARNLSAVGKTVAHYAGVMFGQKDFLSPTTLPDIYTSMFGNLYFSDSEVKVSEPNLIYASSIANCDISPFWAYMSAMRDELCDREYPGEALCERAMRFGFMKNTAEYDYKVTLITACTAATFFHTSREPWEPMYSDIVADFYSSFLYGCTGKIEIIRHAIFAYMLNDMAKQVGETEGTSIFNPHCKFINIASSPTISHEPGSAYGRGQVYRVMETALEALMDDEPKLTDNNDEESKTAEKGKDDEEADSVKAEDNSEEDAAADDSAPPETDETDAASEDSLDDSGEFGSDPAPDESDKNNIGLISFDKTGENIDAGLYRDAVLELCVRINEDESLPITQEVRESLNQWVNGYLYRAAISETKSRIQTLKLQKFLKPFS